MAEPTAACIFVCGQPQIANFEGSTRWKVRCCPEIRAKVALRLLHTQLQTTCYFDTCTASLTSTEPRLACMAKC